MANNERKNGEIGTAPKSKIPFYKKPMAWGIALLSLAVLGTVIALPAFDSLDAKKTDYYNSPSALAAAYKSAVLKNDFEFMEKFQFPDKKPVNQSSNEKQLQDEICNTLKISDIKITKKLEFNHSAYYEFEINVTQSGASAYRSGKNIRCLFLKKASGKWYAEGLMSDNFLETEDQINLYKLADSRMAEGG